MKVQDLNYSVKMEYRETAKLTETQHLQPSNSTLTKEVSVESEKGFLLLTFINVRSTQLVSLHCLFTQSSTSEQLSFSA